MRFAWALGRLQMRSEPVQLPEPDCLRHRLNSMKRRDGVMGRIDIFEGNLAKAFVALAAYRGESESVRRHALLCVAPS